MALLPQGERDAAYKEYTNGGNCDGGLSALSTADVKAAVAALDQWLEDNAAAANAALPVAFRTAASDRQKALLMSFVIYRRYLAEG